MSLYITLSPLAGLFNTTALYIILSIFGVSSSERIHLLIVLGPALLITAGVGRIVVKGSEGLWVHLSSERNKEAISGQNMTEEVKDEPWNIPLPPTRPSSPTVLLPGTFAQEPEPAAPTPPESTLPTSLGDVLPLSDPQSLNVGCEEQFHSPGSLPVESTSASSSGASSSLRYHESSLQAPSSSLPAILSTPSGSPQHDSISVLEYRVPSVDPALQVLEYVSQTGVDSIDGAVVPTVPSTPEWIEDETYNPWHRDPALEVDEHEQDVTATLDLDVPISTAQDAEVSDASEGTASPGSSTVVDNAPTATCVASSSAAGSEVEHQSSTSEAAPENAQSSTLRPAVHTASTSNPISPSQPSHSSRTFKFSPIVVPENATVTPRTTILAQGRRIQRLHRNTRPRGPSMARPILSEASYERLVQELKTMKPRGDESLNGSEEVSPSVNQSERVDVKGKGRERQPPMVSNGASSSKATPGRLSEVLMVPLAPSKARSPACQELSGAQFNLQATASFASPGQTLGTASHMSAVSSSNQSTMETPASSSSRSSPLHHESSSPPSSTLEQGTQFSTAEATLLVSPANVISPSSSSTPSFAATPSPNDTQTNLFGSTLSTTPHQITFTVGSKPPTSNMETHSASRGLTRPPLSDSSYDRLWQEIKTSQKGKQREMEIVGQGVSSNVEGKDKASFDMGSSRAMDQGVSSSTSSGVRLESEATVASTSALPQSRIPLDHIGASSVSDICDHHPLDTDALLSDSISRNQPPSQPTSSTSSALTSTSSPSISPKEVDGSTSSTSQTICSPQGSSESLDTPAPTKQPKPRVFLPDRCRIPSADEECYVCCDNLLEGGLDPNEYDLDVDLETLEQALML
ncbi:hypothetical protein VNI00_013032 [Paramarasmius palmivorus]|uniref:Uncharacterized protein n=1 Tax=Paramarasmius palmivorus TaxID=297713 RepID=A0AAW0BZK5_9AGAR